MSVVDRPTELASPLTGSRPRPRPGLAGRGPALAGAVLGSRLLVLVAALAGATLSRRQRYWPLYDHQHLSSHFGTVGNALAASAFRWDSVHYLQIATHGYASRGQAAFFPLYPALMRLVGWVVGSPVVGGVIVSLVSFAVAILLLHRLAEQELGRRAADATVLLLAFAPVSLFFGAVYTESLFLALSVGAVYAARRDRLGLAALLAALATVTRISGILLVVPLALLHLRRGGRSLSRLGWLALPPLALLGFLAYLHSRGYGWLAPIHAQTSQTHAHSLSGPIATVIQAVRSASDGFNLIVYGSPVFEPRLAGPFSLPFQNILLLAILFVACLALVLCWRRLPRAYFAYAALALLLTISSPVQFEPLKSLDRYALTIFPLWMAAGAWAAQHRVTRILVPLGALALAFYSFEFATWAFIA